MRNLRTLVVGAGIGGLSTALSLHAAGLGDGVTVVDASRRLLPVGAGINLQPHAVRELTELGLGERLVAASAEPRELLLTDRYGNRITSHRRGRAAGYRWPQLSVHRGELQRILLDAVRERLGPGTVRTGFALEGFEEHAEGVTGLLRDCGHGGPDRGQADRGGPGGGGPGGGGPGGDRTPGRRVELEADVLIGADGLHSAVRRRLHPEEGEPCWSGIRMWRGVTPAPPPLDGSTMLIAGSHRPARIVVYPLGDGQVNWVAEVRASAPDAAVRSADWSREGQLADVLPYFDGWCIDGLEIGALLRGAPRILYYPMVDRDPLPRWGRGRVTLLGDAAHPMLPVGSNGGSQAVLDARVLARELARELTPGRGARQDPTAALRAYENVRLGPVNEIAAACRDMPSDRMLDTVAERAPDGFRDIREVLGEAELTRMHEGMRRTTDMEVAALNSRPSWTAQAN